MERPNLPNMSDVVSTLKGSRESYELSEGVLRMREGTIVSVQATTCTVTYGGTASIPGIRWIGSTPATGRCILLQQGRVVYVLGNPSR